MSHPIIALWSHPRSMSTAFERIMRTRGDLKCLHEPFMYDYYIHRSKREMPHFDAKDDHPRDYQSIRDMILAKAESSPVFFKDMSYYVMPHLFDDPEFVDRVTHSFLVREPVASIVSYAKLDPELTLEEIGIEAQWRHFERLPKAVVVLSEDVRSDAAGTMQRYWSAVGLADKPQALDWNQPAPEDWQQVSGWHKDVMTSKGIKPLESDHEARTQAQFAQLVAEQPRFQKFYEHHKAFYDLLRARAI
ncbi:hypothetical protein [Aestuariivirga sp.]|uniref:sulfotransferase-like domain-containing protein n=1 Tax=Aestuariivirga sp. TaxID=2650926 RepID=UPI00359474CD